MMANVLVVDDERSMRVSLREFLRDAGYEVGVAEDAQKAMEMLTANDFDLVLADIILPATTGMGLLKEIKAVSPRVQVILMTGEPTVETASEAVRADAFDYLAKPIGKEDLLRAVAKAARLKDLDDTLRCLAAENLQYQEDLERLVEERTAEIRRLNEGLEQKVAERTRELAAANERLKELDRLKSVFIASMSHELRTPLNSIIGFAGMIIGDMAGPISDQQRDYLQRVYAAGKHLLALITDVIDISKIEAGKLAVAYEPFDLGAVVTEAIGEVEREAQEKGLSLTVDVPTGISVHTDRKRLLQCLLNFLSNAVKYSERGGILVETEADGDHLSLCVSDTGIGIPEDERGLLFQPFVRLQSPLTMHTTGTGLGLYLTRKLAREVLGGGVEYASRAGGGSKFTLRILRRMPQAEHRET